MKFAEYLFEGQNYLGDQISDILSAVQELQNDMGGMGTRQIADISEDIVNQLRKILHGHWTPQQMPIIKELQKVAVALMKSIDDKDDLKTIIPTISQTLADTASKLGVKSNKIESVPEGDVSQDDFQLTGQDPGEQAAGGQQAKPQTNQQPGVQNPPGQSPPNQPPIA
jgi:hypothetical protein